MATDIILSSLRVKSHWTSWRFHYLLPHMNNLELTKPPVAKAAMLIRRPVGEVFDAFIDPAITSKFWFTKSTGRLEPGKRVTWTWEMYDVSADVEVKSIEPAKRILIEWGNYGEMTTVGVDLHAL